MLSYTVQIIALGKASEIMVRLQTALEETETLTGLLQVEGDGLDLN